GCCPPGALRLLKSCGASAHPPFVPHLRNHANHFTGRHSQVSCLRFERRSRVRSRVTPEEAHRALRHRCSCAPFGVEWSLAQTRELLPDPARVCELLAASRAGPVVATLPSHRLQAAAACFTRD